MRQPEAELALDPPADPAGEPDGDPPEEVPAVMEEPEAEEVPAGAEAAEHMRGSFFPASRMSRDYDSRRLKEMAPCS